MEMSAQFQNWREGGRQQAQQRVSIVVGASGGKGQTPPSARKFYTRLQRCSAGQGVAGTGVM